MFRPQTEHAPQLPAGARPDDYVRYALFHNPQLEAAYERWRAASEREPQMRALPDPRLSFGYFVEEVETRVGPQRARAGIQQTFPWPGTLMNRGDAASRAAEAEWHRFEAARLSLTERVVSALHELAFVDESMRIARQNLELLASFEDVVRARYRVGASSHPELVRVQVALGQLEDRVAQLVAMRPAFTAELNAALNREAGAEVEPLTSLPGLVIGVGADELTELARESNPTLSALAEQAQEQRLLAEVARKRRLPDFTVGLEYILTDDALDPSMEDSGKDPIVLTLGLNLPVWRGAYAAGVREARARARAVAHQREDEANRIGAAVQRAWFEHTDAHRRVGLYEQNLIPKAEESLRASLAGFRAGDTSFLALLDSERSLLEFALSAERARADRGKALARLQSLVGAPLPVDAVQPPSPDEVPR